MITPTEARYITEHAYVPEHLPDYVNAISQTDTFLVGDFVAYLRELQLILVGYPLAGSYNETEFLQALHEAKSRFEPASVSLIAPAIPVTLQEYTHSPTDAYYRIELAELTIPQKTRNMIMRARQQISVFTGKFNREHKKLIDQFLCHTSVDDGTRFIFQRIGEYAKYETALVFDARNHRGELIAFDIAEFGAKEYAFYMFNFRSSKHKIPGASDLLLSHIIAHAKEAGQRYINLGLGINPGVTFFKKKWGAKPFLNYISSKHESGHKESWSEFFEQFSDFPS